MTAGKSLVPSSSQTVGPFFHIGLTTDKTLGRMAKPNASGQQIRLIIRVLDREGVGIPDSMIELWQADANGKYDHPDDLRDISPDPYFSNFGRMETDREGRCEFQTVRPGRVPGVDQVLQAPHINVHVFSRGILWHVSTRIYFADDSWNEHDAVLNLVPAERRPTLVAAPLPSEPGTFSFDIRLCGTNETVFFEV